MKRKQKMSQYKKEQQEKKRLNQKRRRAYGGGVEKRDELHIMIDGNETYFPYVYCNYYHGWLTKNLTRCHRCEAKKCPHAIAYAVYIEKYENGKKKNKQSS